MDTAKNTFFYKIIKYKLMNVKNKSYSKMVRP